MDEHPKLSPEDRARHLKNRDDLLVARAVLVNQWEAEDVVRAEERKEHLEAFDRGLADFVAKTGIEPDPVAPVVEPAPAAPVAAPVG